MMDKEYLLIPVYLNQRIVFDLIAMLQGGISAVTTVTKFQGSKDESVERAKASFGLAGALSALLKIGLSAEKSISTGEGSSKQTSDERVHTPASLFYMLRNILIEKGRILEDAESITIKPGDIIEFEASLNRNPIIETMDAMTQLMELAPVFSEPPKSEKESNQKQGADKLNKIKKQLVSFTEILKTGDSIDLTTGKLKSGHKASNFDFGNPISK